MPSLTFALFIEYLIHLDTFFLYRSQLGLLELAVFLGFSVFLGLSAFLWLSLFLWLYVFYRLCVNCHRDDDLPFVSFDAVRDFCAHEKS